MYGWLTIYKLEIFISLTVLPFQSSLVGILSTIHTYSAIIDLDLEYLKKSNWYFNVCVMCVYHIAS